MKQLPCTLNLGSKKIDLGMIAYQEPDGTIELILDLTTLNQMLAAMDNEDFSVRAVLVGDKLRWQMGNE